MQCIRASCPIWCRKPREIFYLLHDAKRFERTERHEFRLGLTAWLDNSGFNRRPRRDWSGRKELFTECLHHIGFADAGDFAIELLETEKFFRDLLHSE